MSDSGRVQIPYGTHSTSNKTKSVPKKTVRICVRLPPSTEDTCPEYNFKDELDAAKKKGSSIKVENGDLLDMFADDDGDVRRIAMEMEEKYGKSVSVPKKKRKGRKDDYADIGMGYDESDSFIDNTDGYDEIIPQNVTTLLGGFYVNCGALEFKTDDENSNDSSSSSSKSGSPSPRNGKRTLDSDDSDTEERQIKKSKSEFGSNGMQKAIKKKLFSPNKILKKKRSSGVFKKTVKDLLKEKRKDLNLSVSDSPVREQNNSVLNEGDRLSSQGTDEVKVAQLPENLPNNISEVIVKLKQTANSSTSGNKFTDEINSLLLSMERRCKCLGKPSKTKVYEHLSHFMKVDKSVLVKHCHQLMMKEEEKKIKSLLHKLKSEIDKVMPSIILNYEKECELVLERRSLLQQQNQEGGDEKRKQIGRPKRKFQWNDQTKKYLKDTATLKKRSYLQQGNSKESWEEELSTFLKNNVLHLWPEGWMTMTSLTKAVNKLFNDPKTANQTPSSAKKENKNTTAPLNTSNIAYPNISITPLTSNARTPEKTSNPVKEKIEIIDVDKVSNGNMFYKVDYEKPVSNVETKDVTPKANIVIDLDSPSDFSNLLPKTNCLDTSSEQNLDDNHRNPSDDILNVMERLKNLQKMSSPVKSFEGSSSSNFSQKQSSVLKNNIDLVTSSFQDEFQKQLYSALGNLTQTPSKSNYKCS